ncbi:unnamed protein product [Paramecium sonneborni]|uniref:Uncharacterized protein n=1 Tax=Paramecium sonneborni TaxID=65129 RepID=A0A8S1PGE1_9CILI|nr:unnamed protein product [Paramecium sonneborni]
MEKCNSFVSGSQDKSLRIWKWNMDSNKYICTQILNGKMEQQFVTINKNEDQIVIGGENQVSFWKLTNLQWSNFQILNFGNYYILGLNLSPSQQKLVTCLNNNKIIIIQQQIKNTQTIWEVQSEIYVTNYGYSLFFRNDDLIAFQPIDKSQIIIFQLDCNGIFQFKTKINFNEDDRFCQIEFPFFYNENKNIFVVKVRYSVYFVVIQDNLQLQLYQKTSFSNYNILGVMSKNGQQFISWDYGNKLLQIRQFQSYCFQPEKI